MLSLIAGVLTFFKGTRLLVIREDLKEKCRFLKQVAYDLQLICCRSFMNVISELDHPLITEEWIRLTTQKGRRSFALRLRNPWIDEATGTPRQKWILCSCGKPCSDSFPPPHQNYEFELFQSMQDSSMLFLEANIARAQLLDL
jgi:hypothetical protein